MTLKILNLYAGIGGNRKLWSGDIEVTAVEIEPQIATAYQNFFPNDKVIIADAHQYLLDHFAEYDFIWASPPCPTHSILGRLSYEAKKTKPKYAEMSLYQEIILLTHFFKGKWVIENTKSYYIPLIIPFESGNHYFWSNFIIPNFKLAACRAVSVSSIKEKEELLGFNLDDYSFNEIEGSHHKDKVLNNCVEPELGLHIFKMAFKEKQQTLFGDEK